MLFLIRPRQSWMPYAIRRPQQTFAYQQMEKAYGSTRRVAPPEPPDKFANLRELERLRQAGVLTDAEFTSAKSRILADEGENR